MKITVSIVGAGSLGTALAYALPAAGIRVNEIVTRGKTRRLLQLADRVGAHLVGLNQAALQSRVLWITTPDSAIEHNAAAIAKATSLHRRIVLHSSGVLSNAALQAAHNAGAFTASAHPMMSFPRTAVASFKGVVWAVEGDPPAVKAAREIIAALAGTALKINADAKPSYHAVGTLSSPLLVSLLAAAESAALSSGLTRREAHALMRPIVERTIANFFADGAAAGFSGPFQRGEVATIALHLKALRDKPAIAAAYRSLALNALASLPVRNRAAIRKLLLPGKLPASQPARRASAKSVRN